MLEFGIHAHPEVPSKQDRARISRGHDYPTFTPGTELTHRWFKGPYDLVVLRVCWVYWALVGLELYRM